MTQLKLLTPAELQNVFPVHNRIITLGRSPENDIQVDIPEVAAVHASILSHRDRHLLIDHSSPHGTFVDNARIDRRFIRPGSRIRLGQTVEFLLAPSPGIYAGSNGNQRLLMDEKTGGPISDIQKSMTLEEAGFDYGQGLPEKSFAINLQNRHLSTIYQVNQAMTETFDLKELAHKVLELIFQIFQADRAAIILCDPGTHQPYPVALMDRSKETESGPIGISQTTVRKVMEEKSAVLAVDTLFDERFKDVSSIMRKQIRSVMCVPLHSKGKILGTLYADSIESPNKFSEDDLRLMFAVGGALANSIENASLVERIKDEERKLGTLERYLPSAVVHQLFDEALPAELGGRHAMVSVLFADIRGFTNLAEKTPPVEIVHLLNKYFSSMSEVVFEYGGTLGEYIGDEIMAYFGAPIPCDDHVNRAISVALKMKERMRLLRDNWTKSNSPVFGVGIGIATGEVIAGNVGSEKQMKYTIIGATVNLANRLCAHAQAGQILTDSETYHRAGKPKTANYLKAASLKGISRPVDIFEILYPLR